MILRVNLGPRSYDIAVVSGDPVGLGPFFRDRCRGRSAVVVTDANVRPHAEAVAIGLRAEFTVNVIDVPAGEESKAIETASLLYDRLADIPANRDTLIVAVGGGVIGDLAGFVAATYNRGLPLLMVPTTLLAMVDSSVGGKVGVNHPKGKNLIGAFHQPVGVWIDTACIDTLPAPEYRSGLAEVVKYGMILDAEFFSFLAENADAILAREPACVRHMIRRCCELKARVVEQDEREEIGLRMVLNFGHTFGHAFETVGGYSSWRHGEAVAAGMVCACRLAERLGRIPGEVTKHLTELLRRFGLPTEHEPDWPVNDVLRAMARDKKASAGRLRFVLPARVGHAEVVADVPDSLVHDVLMQPA